MTVAPPRPQQLASRDDLIAAGAPLLRTSSGEELRRTIEYHVAMLDLFAKHESWSDQWRKRIHKVGFSYDHTTNVLLTKRAKPAVC